MIGLDSVIANNGDEWIDAIPAAVRGTVKEILSNGASFDEAADIWLRSSGADYTSPFGAPRPKTDVASKVRSELRKFVCGDPEYADLRQKAVELTEKNKVAVVALVASAVGSTLGIAAAVIVPVIGLLFAAVAKVGINVWCSSDAI